MYLKLSSFRLSNKVYVSFNMYIAGMRVARFPLKKGVFHIRKEMIGLLVVSEFSVFRRWHTTETEENAYVGMMQLMVNFFQVRSKTNKSVGFSRIMEKSSKKLKYFQKISFLSLGRAEPAEPSRLYQAEPLEIGFLANCALH